MARTVSIWREQKGITLREFAALLGISAASAYRYERGLREWPLPLAVKVKKLTGLTDKELTR